MSEAGARRAVLALGLGGLLAACGFEPLYAPGGPAAGIDGRVSVDVIAGTPGYLMRERLLERLGAAAEPTHRLTVALELEQVGVALTEQDVTTRFDVRGDATWTLTQRGSDVPVLSGAETATTGYSAPSSNTTSVYAVRSAQEDAQERVAVLLADRIAQKVALAAQDWAR